MPRQARSETTRRSILDAAVELFNEDGYAATGLGDIIERAALSKGALDYHFDSKESLAAAIMAEAAGTVYAAVRAIVETASPAFESMIHSSFIVAEIVAADPLVRTGSHLSRSLGGFTPPSPSRTWASWRRKRTRTARAAADGDLRPELDIEAVADTPGLSAYSAPRYSRIPPRKQRRHGPAAHQHLEHSATDPRHRRRPALPAGVRLPQALWHAAPDHVDRLELRALPPTSCSERKPWKTVSGAPVVVAQQR